MDWQPIDTAPKDGSSILVVDYDNYVDKDMYLVFWYDDQWSVESVNSVIPLAEETEVKGHIVFTPTHWCKPHSHPNPKEVEYHKSQPPPDPEQR